VLADAAVKARWLALGNRAPTEKSPQRTLLEKHLSDYTTKNTADYFIHKDLGGFPAARAGLLHQERSYASG
jgi:adenine-specific DNA-methyltransferase